jgi:hypothetical protein
VADTVQFLGGAPNGAANTDSAEREPVAAGVGGEEDISF